MGKIPRIVKRNTILLALSMAFSGAGAHMIYALTPLMVLELFNSASLAGIGLSIIGISRLIVAYPVGKLTDTYGRKPGLALGIGLGLVGAMLAALSIIFNSVPVFFVAMLALGLGIGAAHQLRVAAADMYPPARRAEGLGMVLTGSLLGVFVGPGLVLAAQNVAPSVGLNPLGLSWLFVPVVGLPSLYVLWLVRPDPKEIATNLGRYYPGYSAPPSRAMSERHLGGGMSAVLTHFPKRLATVANFAAQGNMAIVMVIIGLVLHDHGHTLVAISFAQAWHSIGMFGFSLPIGKLADSLGRKPVLLLGTFVEAVGALLVALPSDYVAITLGGILVGVGWSCVSVAATSIVADTSVPGERGRAIGAVDTFSGVAAIGLPLVAGPMAEGLGLASTGILAVVLMIPPALMLLALHEPRPGRYEQRAAGIP